jgi:hypothetical protein
MPVPGGLPCVLASTCNRSATSLSLPDAAQADALRLREGGEPGGGQRPAGDFVAPPGWFGEVQCGPAWKSVLALSGSPDPHRLEETRQ